MQHRAQRAHWCYLNITMNYGHGERIVYVTRNLCWSLKIIQAALASFFQVTHWQSPHMHAYFPALNSYPSLLGDMLANGMLQQCAHFQMKPIKWNEGEDGMLKSKKVPQVQKSSYSVCQISAIYTDTTHKFWQNSEVLRRRRNSELIGGSGGW